MWNVTYTYIEDWLDSLDTDTVALIFAALELLEQQGPSLGRPLVDTLRNSTLSNLKELRPASTKTSEIRILFVFDPQRNAILLLGGDKSKGKNRHEKWSSWYKSSISRAEQIYRNHLKAIGDI